VSNQVTLGRPASRILEQLERVTARLEEFEVNARQTLLRDARAQVEDKVFRALGILKHARMLTSQEFLNMASAARMGVGMGLLSGLDARLLNELMVLTKPAHLQQRAGRQLESAERDRIRAEMVRSRLALPGS
jgi:protein arginine kinase